MIPNTVPIHGGNDFKSETDQSRRKGLVDLRRKYSCEEMQLSVAPHPCALYTRQGEEAAAVVPEVSGNFLNCEWGEMFMVLPMGALGNVEQQGTRSGCV